MTRIFVAEFLCGGGMFDTPLEHIPPSLLREGNAMWQALVEDMSSWAKVVTAIDPRLPLKNHGCNVDSIEMNLETLPWNEWVKAAQSCDAAILIVPESDGLLTKAITRLRAAGIDVVAVSNAALGLVNDKWNTARWLHRHGVPHPETWALNSDSGEPIRSHPIASLPGLPSDGFLVKPRDGCGALDIRYYDELSAALDSMLPHEITQRKIIGRPASVSVVANQVDHAITFLPAVWQSIEWRLCEETRSCLVYQGGLGPVSHEYQLRSESLAARVIESLPGKSSGFIGIDWIVGSSPAQDCIIEINPRLTTSYLGTRQMLAENITQRLIKPNGHAPRTKVLCDSVSWSVQDPVRPKTDTDT